MENGAGQKVVAAQAEESAPASAWSKLQRRRLSTLVPFAALIFLTIAFSLAAPNQFATYGNLSIILQQAAVLAIIGFGQTFVIVAGSIDLSVGSVLALAGVIAASVGNQSIVTGLGLGLLVGAIAGLTNGLAFTRLRIPSFIVTLGMMSIARGATILYSHGSPIVVSGDLEILGRYPYIVYVVAITFLIVYLLFNYTRFGLYGQAIGGDERVSALTGVRVTSTKVWVFVLCGMLTGLGGAILAARSGAATPTAGLGFELDVISAVVLGGTPLTGGIGSVQGTIVGALIMTMLADGLVILGVSSELQMVIKGIILMLAVFISLERGKIGVIK